MYKRIILVTSLLFVVVAAGCSGDHSEDTRQVPIAAGAPKAGGVALPPAAQKAMDDAKAKQKTADAVPSPTAK